MKQDSLFEQPKVKIYTVSQITSLIKTSLENSLPGQLTITGEISGFKRHSGGHCYFDLKDEKADSTSYDSDDGKPDHNNGFE